MRFSLGGINVGHPGTNYEKLMSKTFSLATEWLGKHATKSDVVVLAPCGSSRAELLRRLLVNTRYFSKAYVYRGFKGKLKCPSQEVEEYESIDELIDKLKNKAGNSLAVVPESSFDALLLKDRLKKVLPNIRVRLLYLPALYSRATKELNWPSKDVKNLATVEHTWLGKAYKWRRSAKGYSSTLLRDWKKEELEELKKAKEAILALSPGNIGLKDYVLEFLRKSALSLATIPIGLLGSYGLPFLLAIVKLLPLAEEETRQIVANILGRAGETLNSETEGFVQEVFENLSKPEARNNVAAGIAGLVRTAKEATPYLNREELETIVDQVALEWGVRTDPFKAFIENLARMTSGKVATQQELRELEESIKEKLGEIWSEIEMLKKELEAVQEELKEEHAQVVLGVKVLGTVDVESGGLSAGFKVKMGVPLIEDAEGKARVVTAGTFRDSVEEVLSKLEKGLVVVLEGPKGTGKSVLAAYATWLALLRHKADAVIKINELKSGERSFILNYLERIQGKKFIISYDPSPIHAYYETRAVSTFTRDNIQSLATTLEELIKLSESNSRVYVLAVLPGGSYETIAREYPELKSRLEGYLLHVNFRDPVFLEQIVREYAKPKSTTYKHAYQKSLSKIKPLAEKIASLQGGYTLVAKYVGITLRKKGYRVEDAEKLLEEAKGDAKRFIAYYLWSVILKENKGDLARRLAVPLLLHAYFGPVPIGIIYLTKAVNPEGYWRFLKPEEVKGKLPSDLSEKELEPVAKWLSLPHEDLVEETLEEISGVRGKMAQKKYLDVRELIKLLDEVSSKVVNETAGQTDIMEKKSEKHISGYPDILLFFVQRRLAPALISLKIASSRCLRKLALIAGCILIAHPQAPLAVTEMSPLLGDALKPCELDSYLLVGSEIPSLVVRVVLQRPSVLAHPLALRHKEAAKELEKLLEAWRSREKASPDENLYGLGLALAVAGAFWFGESVEAWEAEAALYTAISALHQVLSKESATVILDSLIRHEELEPHYYILLASATSTLIELNEETVHKITDVLEEALEREELKVRGWPLVEAVRAYSNLLTKHREHFLGEEERLRERMCKLLEWLEGQLRDIAEAIALNPALQQGLKPCGGADPAGRAEELLKRLEEMEKEEPNGQAAEWATVLAFKPERFKLLVKHIRGMLSFSLAWYKMDNDDLEAARKLFTVSAEIYRELKYWVNYLDSHLRATRCSVLVAKNLEELRERARAFEELWDEAKKQETLEMAYLHKESFALAGYLVFLALEDRKDEVSMLLEREKWLLQLFPRIYVTTRLLLERLGVGVGKPEAREVATALNNDVNAEFRPAFNTLMGRPRDALKECNEFIGAKREICRIAVNAINGDKDAIMELRLRSIKVLSHKLNLLLGGDILQDFEENRFVQIFYRELLDFIYRRNASALIQFWAPVSSLASFTLMLWALVNSDEELAKAHAKLAWMRYKNKLPRRLFREAAEARSEEELKLALLKLFYFHF